MNWEGIKRLAGIDAHLSNRVRIQPQHRFVRRIAVFLAHSGDSWFWLAGLGLIWLFAGKEWHNLAAYMGISLVFLAVFVLAIKFTVRRERPQGDWGSIYRSTDPHSFPSGHAARAALFAVIALSLGPAWFGWALLIWAPLVSAARVAMGVHYLSDVIAGGVIGVTAGLVMVELYLPIYTFTPLVFLH